ncbi:MAG: ferritin-like domain-containing protein [Thermosphaera sp.]
MNNLNLSQRLEKMSLREKEYSEMLLRTVEKFRHPVLAALFTAVALDSLKHSRMYESLVKLIKTEPPFLTEEEYREISESIEHHIKTEADMIRQTQELIEQASDSRCKLILEAIYKDEIIHHQLLTMIKEKLAKKELLSEEVLWDSIWRESPWHGTPGG